MRRAGPRAPLGLLSAGILACALGQLAAPRAASAQAAGGTAAAKARAILSRGTEAVRGLPFFSPNAIPALRADYLLVPADAAPADAAAAVEPGRAESLVRVWCTRESLVFGPAWKRGGSAAGSFGDRRAFLSQRPEGFVLALVAERYVLFFELPEDSAGYRSFAAALDRRFAVFFDRAQSDAELSFPASVDFVR